jgi:hypothetical protein
MLRCSMILGAFAVALLGACSQPPQKADTPPAVTAPDPAETIRPLYTRYMTDPAVTTFPSLEEQAPWSASMRQALVDMMTRSEQAQAPILDFDPFVNAQDWQISNVNVTTDSVAENSHAVVRASFQNGGSPQEVVYDLVWEGGGWRVDNVRSGGPPDGWDLRQIANSNP